MSWTPSVPWLPNSTSPFADGANKDGNRPAGVLVAEANFVGAVLDPGWSSAGDQYLSYSEGEVLASYPNTETNPSYASPLIVPTGGVILNQTEVFFEFDARKTPGGGSKFVKVHGLHDGASNSANCTFNNDYEEPGLFRRVIFGDGTTTDNDAQNFVDFANGGTTNGRNSDTAILNCPNGVWTWPDENWHNFKLHVKFNTGTTALNEVPDGEFHVYIDGQLYCSATNLYNRHYSNRPIEYCEFLSRAQNTTAFNLGMRKIKVSLDGWT
jgi:hypothetical protein